MNFTREPIIETIITPKEGYKLVVRSSKGASQEEFFVDAIEVISFGQACFYRSLEKPKCFLVPVADYEVLEVRETRVMLKTSSIEKGGIKIGGGREAAIKPPKEEVAIESEKATEEVEASEGRVDKKRERRRFRKKRGKSEEAGHEEEEAEGLEAPFSGGLEDETKHPEAPKPREERATLIPPPSTLISETLARYKDTPGFSSAFFEKKEEQREEVIENGMQEKQNLLVEDVDELEFLTDENPRLEIPDEEEESL